MTNEEKQMLFKILCEMLPYGVKVSITAHNLDYEEDFGKTIIADLMGIQTAKDDDGITHTCFITCYDEYKTQGNDIETIKPYLRPMSSMTEEEYKELKSISSYYGFAPYEYICDWCPNYEMIEWLNEHHFDYHGLIEKELALEAPEGMYNN